MSFPLFNSTRTISPAPANGLRVEPAVLRTDTALDDQYGHAEMLPQVDGAGEQRLVEDPVEETAGGPALYGKPLAEDVAIDVSLIRRHQHDADSRLSQHSGWLMVRLGGGYGQRSEIDFHA